MNYDLDNFFDRKRFIKRAIFLLKKRVKNAKLADESKLTPKQNNYIHVLCRIVALEFGMKEADVKSLYFKKKVNNEIFHVERVNMLTGEVMEDLKHTYELSIEDASKAIHNFIMWASTEHGIELPVGEINEDKSVTFASKRDEESFNAAVVLTSKADIYL